MKLLPFPLVGALLLLGPRAGGAVEVHRYASGAPGIFANAYLVETAHGVVAVDATLTETDSKALRAQLESLRKPLLAVLLTHGHPDHYNGVTNLLRGDRAPVVATAGVDKVIRETDAAKELQWKPTFGEEWPVRRTFPSRTVGDGETLTFDGVAFTVHDLGPGESHSDSIWITSGPLRAAFIGDVVLNGVHAYLSDGHSTAWLANLDRVRRLALGVPSVYPGHGEPGTVSMLDWEKRYLLTYRTEVAALAAGHAALTEEQKKALVARMKEELPTDKLEFLIGLGADAVAAELAPRPKSSRRWGGSPLMALRAGSVTSGAVFGVAGAGRHAYDNGGSGRGFRRRQLVGATLVCLGPGPPTSSRLKSRRSSSRGRRSF